MKYFKATGKKGVTVTRSSSYNTYTYAVIAFYAARAFRDTTVRAKTASSWASRHDLALKAVGQFKQAAWAEIAPAIEIDAAEFRALKKHGAQ